VKFNVVITLIICLILSAGDGYSQSTVILIGGEETELSNEGVITGRGSSLYGGLGAALLDTFNIYYQPLGEGDFQDNLFPDPEVYSFQMNIPEGLPNYQSQGIHGSFWDSQGREGEGVLPWIREDWREGRYYDAQYNPAGEESPFGLVSDSVRWKIDYWEVDDDDEICFIHTCLAGMVEDFNYNEESGDATALLVTLQTAYLGYGEDGEPGPGAVEYEGGTYQGFDSFRERSGLLDFPAYFFQYDGETNEGSLTPCGTKVLVRGEGIVKGYFDSIQAGIDASEDGDTVLVPPGEYVENINFEGKAISVIGNPEEPGEVIINGNGENSVVIFESGEGENSVLRGFTVTNGQKDIGGGGIRCAGRNGTSPTLEDLIIVDNSTQTNGGGIYIWRGAPIISRCLIAENNAMNGAGFTFMTSAPILSEVVICDNVARNVGGGFYSDAGMFNFNNVLIANNRADGGGGAAYIHFTNVNGGLMENVTIVGNNAGNNFGTISVVMSEEGGQVLLTLLNCIVHSNEEPEFFVMGWNDQNMASLRIAYSNIENGQESIERRNEFVNLEWGEGNIDENPLFADPDNGDYHLTEDSPCIDTGDPDSPEDPDGTRADMGAFYFHQDPDENPHRLEVPIEYETIQAAIDASEDGDTVLVHPGEYVENINFEGKVITLGSLLLTTGDEDFIIPTIIDGDSSGTVVTFENGETEETKLIGVSIRNGVVEGNGGGIRCSNSSPIIDRCLIFENYATARGGGISCEPEAHPQITGCVINVNSVGSGGGGIWIGETSNPRIDGCSLAGNTARWNGGGINIYNNCEPVISNCLIEENDAGSKGGGIIVSQDCNPHIYDSQILDNTSADYGGGITVERNGMPIIRNCLLEDNETEGNGGTIAAIQNSSPRILNCTFDWESEDYTTLYCSASSAVVVNSIVYGFTPLHMVFDPDSAASSLFIAYSDIQGGVESIETNNNGEIHWEDSNIDADPLFMDREEGEYDLTANSPCVDAGTTFYVLGNDTLIDMSEDEYNGNAPDIGAYESEFVNSIRRSGDRPLPLTLLVSTYPNPFNSTTNIEYSLPYPSYVSLNLYNMSGQRIESMVNCSLQAGVYRTNLNSGDLPSGLYFVRLESSDQVFTQKVMLLR